MKNILRKWIERAQYDLVTAQAMFKAGRYLYVAFMCQQSLEKLLKAHAVARKKDVLRTHNLVHLAEKSGLLSGISEKYLDILAGLTPFAIEARYGDYRQNLSEIINKKKALLLLKETKEVFSWLKNEIK